MADQIESVTLPSIDISGSVRVFEMLVGQGVAVGPPSVITGLTSTRVAETNDPFNVFAINSAGNLLVRRDGHVIVDYCILVSRAGAAVTSIESVLRINTTEVGVCGRDLPVGAPAITSTIVVGEPTSFQVGFTGWVNAGDVFSLDIAVTGGPVVVEDSVGGGGFDTDVTLLECVWLGGNQDAYGGSVWP